jgi:hypothetical protein
MRAIELPFASAGRVSGQPEIEEVTPESSISPTNNEASYGFAQGHGLANSGMVPVVPNPKPFSSAHIARPAPGKPTSLWPKRPRPTASTASLRGTVEELEQTRQLKEDHYAWHCQACLGQYDISVVTPPETYLFLPKYRAPLIEAHHVDHLQNNGALGAANLLALCKYHHDLLGDRLTGAMIRTSLAAKEPMTRCFPGGNDKNYDLAGTAARISLDVAPFVVTIFFTTEHAARWIKPTALASSTEVDNT